MDNPFTSRFALGDKVIAEFPEDDDGTRNYHEFCAPGCTVKGVTFREGKVLYIIGNLQGDERTFDSCIVHPEPVAEFALGDRVALDAWPSQPDLLPATEGTITNVSFDCLFRKKAGGAQYRVDVGNGVARLGDASMMRLAGACGVTGVADDCAPFGPDPQKWVLAAMASKRIPRGDEGPNMHTVGLPQG